MNRELARLVRERAGFRCEYCRLPAVPVAIPFEIEHIVARQHGGTDAPSNLAFTCLHCNKHKGPNLSGIDRAAARRKMVRLFHPRLHRWSYHFAWDGPRIVGKTPIGRATVVVLAMNDPPMVMLRRELIEEGMFEE